MKKFTLLTAMAAMLCAGHAQAQSPTDPPVAPWSADEVYTIYAADEEQYPVAEPVTFTVLNWGGQDVISDDEAGDYAAIRVVAGDGNYTPIQFDKTQNWSDYRYFHMDVWAAEDCQFYIVFRNWSAGVRSGSEVIQMTAGQWYSLDFDMSQFAWSEKNDVQERIVNVLVFGGESEGIYEGAAKASRMWVTNILCHNRNVDATVVGVGKQIEKEIEKPAVSAPVPDKKAGNVSAAYSDVYPGRLEWNLYGWSSCKFDEITIGTDNVQWMKDANWAAVAMSGDISEMEYLHADLWTPAEGGVGTVQFGLQYMSPAVAPLLGEHYTDEAHIVNMTPGQWVSVDIPLSAFDGIDLTNGKQVFRIKTDGADKGNLFLDNIYFWNTKEVVEDSPVPATPKTEYSSVVPVYGQYGVASNFARNAFSKGDCIEIENEGEKIWKMTKFDYVKFQFDAVDFSGMNTLHIDLFTPEDNATAGGLKLVITDSSNKATAVNANNTVTLTAGSWNSFDIPLTEFVGADLSKISLLTIGDIDRAEQKYLYLGSFYAYDSNAGVNDIIIDSTDASQKAYNILGMPVGDDYKGIVIINGKKFVRK